MTAACVRCRDLRGDRSEQRSKHAVPKHGAPKHAAPKHAAPKHGAPKHGDGREVLARRPQHGERGALAGSAPHSERRQLGVGGTEVQRTRESPDQLQGAAAPCRQTAGQERKAAVQPLRLRLPGLCRSYSSRDGCDDTDCQGLHVCRQYLAGICNFGLECRYSHSLTTVHNQVRRLCTTR